MDERLSKIKVLPGIFHIRKRPTMYLGSVDERGIQNLLTLTLGWAITKAKTQVTVTFSENGSVSISHNGDGIPVKKHSKVDKSILELVMTILPCGSGADILPVLTALCKKLIVETTQSDARGDSRRYSMQFEQAVMTSPLSEGQPAYKSGTQITYWIDPEIFGECVLDVTKAKEEISAIQLGHTDLVILMRGPPHRWKSNEEDTMENHL